MVNLTFHTRLILSIFKKKSIHNFSLCALKFNTLVIRQIYYIFNLHDFITQELYNSSSPLSLVHTLEFMDSMTGPLEDFNAIFRPPKLFLGKFKLNKITTFPWQFSGNHNYLSLPSKLLGEANYNLKALINETIHHVGLFLHLIDI